MSNIQTGAERMPHDLSHLGLLAGQIGRLITISTTPVIAGDSFEMAAVGALPLSPLRRGLAIYSTVDIFTFYVPHRHVYGAQWIKVMKDGVNATPLPTRTSPVFAAPWCTSRPHFASLSASSVEVRVSSNPSAGCACRSCRISSSSRWYSRMRSTALPIPPLESGRACFRKPSHRLAAPSRAQRASLAGHAGPIPHLALGSDAAADAGGGGHSLLPALRVPLSRRAGARSRGRGRGAAALERPRLLCPRAQPASGRSKARLRARRQIPGFGRRDRAGSRHRALERRGDRGVRLRPPRCDSRRQRQARARALLRRRRLAGGA